MRIYGHTALLETHTITSTSGLRLRQGVRAITLTISPPILLLLLLLLLLLWLWLLLLLLLLVLQPLLCCEHLRQVVLSDELCRTRSSQSNRSGDQYEIYNRYKIKQQSL